MFYWLSTYLLVTIGVAIPFMLLYLAGLAFGLAVTKLCAALRSLSGELKERQLHGIRWAAMWRKAA